MSLVITDLKDKIITDLDGMDDPAQTNTALGNSIAEYIKDNAEFAFTWVASFGIFPDPIVTASGAFTLFEIVLTPSMATTPNEAQTGLKSQIITGASSALYNITDAGFVTTPSPFSSSPTLSSLDLSITGENQDDAILNLATKIVNWIKAQVPVAPCSGTHTSYTGAGTPISII